MAVDPVSGKLVPAASVKACCHPSHQSHVTTHPASDGYTTALYSVLALAAAAGVGYGCYRLYSDLYLPRQQAAAVSAGVTEKRAAYPVKEVTDEKLFDSTLAEVERTKAPVRISSAQPHCPAPCRPLLPLTAASLSLPAPQAQRVFVLVEGARDPSTGQSWCGDCAQAEPIIERVFSEAKARVSVIRAAVQRSAYAGNAAHPYRTHPQLALQRIPTLYRVENGRVVDQLIETELHDIERVRAFVAA